MRKTAFALLALAGLMSVVAALRYLLLTEFMPYHAVVSGREWSSLEPGMQTIIIGMLKIVGGGFLATGVALVWLARSQSLRAPWAPWAALTVLVAQWVPTLYVTLVLKSSNAAAQPPIVPTLLILALGIGGVVCGWLASRERLPTRTASAEPGTAT